jgi:HlyD family secretion protein
MAGTVCKLFQIPMRSTPSAVLSFIAILLFSCSRKQETAQPTVQNITESVYASGVVKSRNQYQVFATVNALIKNILVQEGDVVTKGQPLITLVNKTPRLAAENAELNAAYTSVAANRDKLNEAKATIDLARYRMQNDSLLLVRQRNLWAQQIGTGNDLEQRQLAYQNAVTAYESALLRYHDLQRQLNFAEQQSRKSAQISNTTLDDYTIRSRINGRVYSVLKEPGELITAQMPVAIVGDATDFLLELQIDEYDIGSVRLGQQVLIHMDSYKGQVFEAVIEKIDPIMNERSRSFTAEARFIKAPPRLYPNLTAEANIIIQTKENTLTIPRNYLLNDTTVLLKDGTKRNVVIGVKDYQRAEVLRGLQKEDVLAKPEP